MRTEYDENPTGVTEQARQKSRKERRHAASKLRAQQTCGICKHSEIDHQKVSGVDSAIRYCHACTDKCPRERPEQKTTRNGRSVSPKDLDKGGARNGEGPLA